MQLFHPQLPACLEFSAWDYVLPTEVCLKPSLTDHVHLGLPILVVVGGGEETVFLFPNTRSGSTCSELAALTRIGLPL
eukprot:277386-Prorocentrum_lima.AAC.1